MDLAQNSELRMTLFSLDLRSTTRTPEWVTTLLSQINSSRIEEIVMHIVLTRSGELEIIDWALLERTLSRPEFSQLRRFTFEFSVVEVRDKAAAVAFIKKKLPQCDASGIIHF
jgi:hypothetical protein